jgi:hypothetical protein
VKKCRKDWLFGHGFSNTMPPSPTVPPDKNPDLPSHTIISHENNHQQRPLQQPAISYPLAPVNMLTQLLGGGINKNRGGYSSIPTPYSYIITRTAWKR